MNPDQPNVQPDLPPLPTHQELQQELTTMETLLSVQEHEHITIGELSVPVIKNADLGATEADIYIIDADTREELSLPDIAGGLPPENRQIACLELHDNDMAKRNFDLFLALTASLNKQLRQTGGYLILDASHLNRESLLQIFHGNRGLGTVGTLLIHPNNIDGYQ